MTPDELRELVEFVHDQLHADEFAVAYMPQIGGEPDNWRRLGMMPDGTWLIVSDREIHGTLTGLPAIHVERFDPRRMLRETAAKRRLLDVWDETRSLHDSFGHEPGSGTAIRGMLNAYERAVRIMAESYADRDGYRQEWAPGP